MTSLPFRACRSELGERYAELCDLVAESAVVGASAGQDQAVVGGVDGALLMAVADGAGGTSGGAEAASAAMDAVRGCVWSHDYQWPEVLTMVDSALHRGQATAVVVQILGDQIAGASVGDSAAWLFAPTSSLELTANQRRKPLLGTGRSMPLPFMATFAPGSVLVIGTDGLFKYAEHRSIARLALGDAPASAFVDLARLPTGSLQDDVAVVVCREADRD